MSDKLLLELYDRVAELEERVKSLESEKMHKIKKEKNITIGKYRYLFDYLYTNNSKSITLNFREIEEIIRNELPPSAYNHRAFWSNTNSHSIALAWMKANYYTTDVDIDKHIVTFEKR